MGKSWPVPLHRPHEPPQIMWGETKSGGVIPAARCADPPGGGGHARGVWASSALCCRRVCRAFEDTSYRPGPRCPPFPKGPGAPTSGQGPDPLTSPLLPSAPRQLQAGKQDYQDPWELSSFLDVKPSRLRVHSALLQNPRLRQAEKQYQKTASGSPRGPTR